MQDGQRRTTPTNWTPVQRWLLKMRSEGRSILLIHHANKSGGQRGTSGREDVLDTVIALREATRAAHPQRAQALRFTMRKNRGFSGADARAFNASLDVVNGRHEWKREGLVESSFNRVVAFAKSGMTNTEITKQLGLNKSTVSRHISRAKEQGLIRDTS